MNDFSCPSRNQLFYSNDKLIAVLGQKPVRLFQTKDVLLGQIRTSPSLLQVDHANTVLAVLEKQCTAPQAYLPFGYSKITEQTNIGFTGQLRDSVSGNYLLGNGKALYNTLTMCRNRVDELSPFGAGGLNSYSYSEGDPVNFFDPSGHFRIGLLAWIRTRGLKRAMEKIGLADQLRSDIVANIHRPDYEVNQVHTHPGTPTITTERFIITHTKTNSIPQESFGPGIPRLGRFGLGKNYISLISTSTSTTTITTPRPTPRPRPIYHPAPPPNYREAMAEHNTRPQYVTSPPPSYEHATGPQLQSSQAGSGPNWMLFPQLSYLGVQNASVRRA
ncbi:RHS repeat-associated core domain-containing protein [Pseudomonas putida]|uniref:RHS repeat-associated core domain-containing protein n=1 Tax=Pseudomonas putida TaxID=303 RepID=UPI0030D32AAE